MESRWASKPRLKILLSSLLLTQYPGVRSVDDALSAEAGVEAFPHRLSLAHFGDGGSLLQSRILLLNPDGIRQAQARVVFRQDDGSPVSPGVDIPSDPLAIAPSGSVFIATDGVGPVVGGSVEVESDRPLQGALLFDGPVGLAGVGPSKASSAFVALVQSDAASGLKTGIAVVNYESEPLNPALTLFDSQGQQVAEAELLDGQSLALLGHTARFADEFDWRPEVDFSSFEGTIRVDADGLIGATVLQVRSSELVTLPVLPATEPPGEEEPREFRFAQFVSGPGVFSEIAVVNTSPDTDAHICLEANLNDGSPFPLQTALQQAPEGLEFDLPARALRILRTAESGPLRVGSLTIVSSSAAVGASLVIESGAGAAGIGAGPEMFGGFATPVETDQARQVDTGVALMNLSPDQGAELTFLLVDSAGLILSRAETSLPQQGQLAHFVTELDWQPTVDLTQFRGQLRVKPTGRISATALRTSPGQFATLPATPLMAGPSLVSLNGRRLMARRRQADGRLGKAEPFTIRGVVWSPAGPGTNTSKTDPRNAQVRRQEFEKWFETDARLMSEANVNAARLVIDPGVSAEREAIGRTVLDELYSRGIMAILNVDDGINDLQRVRNAVNAYKDHPAVLMWMLGSEWNLNRYFGVARTVSEAAERTETAAGLIQSLDSNHPVATSYGEIDIEAADLRLDDTRRYVEEIVPSVDVWALNIYRGSSFGNLFEQWASITDKPMFLGEFGTDAFRTQPGSTPPQGQLDEEAQAVWFKTLWSEIVFNSSQLDPWNVALGGTVFEFNDEWWKVAPAGSQQTGGFPGGHFDGFANEEFFGVFDIQRQAREIRGALSESFAPAAAVSPSLIAFQTLPDRVDTNLPAFVVAGWSESQAQVDVDGLSLPVSPQGDFAVAVPLEEGDNSIRLSIHSPRRGERSWEKTVHFDPSFSTASSQLLYVDSVAASLDGTVIIDLQKEACLGILEGLHVLGISPDGGELYMSDRTVVSTASHQETQTRPSPLAFTVASLAGNAFLVSPQNDETTRRSAWSARPISWGTTCPSTFPQAPPSTAPPFPAGRPSPLTAAGSTPGRLWPESIPKPARYPSRTSTGKALS